MEFGLSFIGMRIIESSILTLSINVNNVTISKSALEPTILSLF